MIENRRLNRFEEKFNIISLQDYYGLKNDNNNKFTINYNRTEKNNLKLDIYFEKARSYDFIDLPYEISNIISGLAATFIKIQLEIIFPENYPLCVPLLSFINIEHNISNSVINLELYYKYIIDNHNELYKKEWSPAIDISKMILDFIQKINHFEYLL
jgi:ubiquitin-protein ligase